MKLTIAALGTAVFLATGASAMVGPYERAVEQPTIAGHLFTTGAGKVEQARNLSNSPEADQNAARGKVVTVFASDSPAQFGADAR